jgi:predicted nucleic acid-binding protein
MESVLDASVWLALAQEDARVKGVQSGPAVMPSLVVAELASLVERGRLDRRRMEGLVQDSRVEDVVAIDCLEGGRLHGQLRRTGHPKVSMVDCIVYAAAQRLGLGLLTLDGDLEGLPGVEVLGKKA